MCKIEKLLQEKYIEQDLAQLELKLGYQFKNQLLFIKSLSHPSLKQNYAFKLYFTKQKFEFEKLEFLGDAVLNLIITDALINSQEKITEGELAKFKNHLVSRKVIADIALNLGINNFLILTIGEQKSGGRKNISNLENALEAIIGAIYLDSDFTQTKKIVTSLWEEDLANISNIILDPKGSLQTLAHSLQLGEPKYQLLEQSGKQNEPTFKIQVQLEDDWSQIAQGKTKKEAEILAAEKLLRLLQTKKAS